MKGYQVGVRFTSIDSLTGKKSRVRMQSSQVASSPQTAINKAKKRWKEIGCPFTITGVRHDPNFFGKPARRRK